MTAAIIPKENNVRKWIARVILFGMALLFSLFLGGTAGASVAREMGWGSDPVGQVIAGVIIVWVMFVGICVVVIGLLWSLDNLK